MVEEDNDDGGPPIDCQRVYKKSELFKFFVQYNTEENILSTLLEHYANLTLHAQW